MEFGYSFPPGKIRGLFRLKEKEKEVKSNEEARQEIKYNSGDS
jgi:hypothetical protein